MIIYGLRNGGAKVMPEGGYPCTHCGQLSSVHFIYSQRYFHVFWIPVFPVGKAGASQCMHCKQVLTEKEMPVATKNDYHAAKSKTKTSVRYFTGLIAFGLFALLLSYKVSRLRAAEKTYIQTPRIGDVYEIKQRNNQYTLYRVAFVDGDKVSVNPHLYEADKSSGLSKIKKQHKNDYSDSFMVFSKKELVDMQNNHIIRDVDRQ